MHTLHGIATSAKSKQDAYNKVDNAIADGMAPWSDWCAIGGGRWAKSDDPLDGVISYQKDEQKFWDELLQLNRFQKEFAADCMERSNWRFKIEEAFNRFTEPRVLPNPFLSKPPEYTLHMEMYHLTNLIELLEGKYFFNSYFYDMQERTSHIDPLIYRIQTKQETNQYLVLVDFHH